MSNLFDDNRLSDYISGIVDRKIKAIALSITSSTGYFKSLINQALGYTTAAQGSAVSAQVSANQASVDATLTTIIWNKFTSQYQGLSVNEPQVSSIGNPIANGAFYIRSSDKRLRIATVTAQGALSWDDAQVAADKASVIAAGTNEFLSVTAETDQTVKGKVAFTKAITIPKVTDWTSNQAVPAVDLADKLTILDGKITAENQRASQANTALSTAIDQEAQRASSAESNIGNALLNFSRLFSTGSNAYGHWEKRPGVLEMWGSVVQSATSEIVATATFPLQIQNADYSVQLTPAIVNSGVRSDLWTQLIRSSKSGVGFNVQYQSDDQQDQSLNGFEWRIIWQVPAGFEPVPAI